MKAVLSRTPGGPETLVVDDIPTPTPAAGEILIAVEAVGVNYPDVLIIEDKYQYKPQRPFAPGGEAAGTVAALGEGVTDFKVGDRVLAFCSWGGMAQQIAVKAAHCAVIPDAMPFEEAAALIFTYGTSHYALAIRGDLKPGENLLILGAAGGVGLAAVELGKALGANVIAACSSEEKAQICLAKGAHHALVYPNTPLDRAAQRSFSDQIKEVCDGVDVICDAVGGTYAEPALRTLRWEGRFLVVGFPAGVPAIPLNLPLLKSCDIRGVFWGAWVENFPEQFRASLVELLDLYAQGKIRPHVSGVYSMADAGKAIESLSSRQVVGKVVVKID